MRSLEKLALFSVALLAFAACTTRGNSRSNEVSRSDRQFVTEVVQSGVMAVEAGKLAADRGRDESVKQLGKQMTTDHGRANQELMVVAARKSIQPPKELLSKYGSILENLSQQEGSRFDRDYIDAMVTTHKEDVSKFQTAAKNADDPDIKEFAVKTLPILQHHLQMAQAVQKSISAS